MSLLYRGSISWMITKAGVEIAESDTESDCLGRVRKAGAGHGDYFSGLTGKWMRLACAREQPADGEFGELWPVWPLRCCHRPEHCPAAPCGPAQDHRPPSAACFASASAPAQRRFCSTCAP